MKYSKYVLSALLVGSITANMYQAAKVQDQVTLDDTASITTEAIDAAAQYRSDAEEYLARYEGAQQEIAELRRIVASYQSAQYIGAASPQHYLDAPLEEALQDYIYDLCVQYGIVDNYTLVFALIEHESQFDAAVISSTDDYGLMQINKCNHEYLQRELGIVDFLDPYDNVRAGIHMLATLLHRYDTADALMAYNMGENRADEFWRRGVHSTTYSDKILELNEIYKNKKNI